MTIWILGIVWMAIAVSAGFAQGLIRSAFALVGIIVGLFLAMPLKGLVIPLLPFIGITNEFAKETIGPVVAFFLVGVAFKVAGNFVHRKVDYYYNYRVGDAHRALWERMNRRVAAALGSIGGLIYFLVSCVLISVLGYFTAQVGASESQSTVLRLFTRMGEDLVSTRMNKVVGGFNPAKPAYFDTCDFIGFLVQNRDVFKRITRYPPIYVMQNEQYLEGDPAKGTKTQLQSIFSDKDYIKLLGNESDPSVILDNPRTQEILTNAEVKAFIQSIDTKDLTAFLTTGKAPKFSEDKILGRWTYNFPASLMLTKREKPDILASELIRQRKELAERFDASTIVATLDKVFSIKLPTRNENSPLPSLTNAPPRVSYTGTWSKRGSLYELDLHARTGGRVNTSPAAVVERVVSARSGRTADTLVFKIDGKTVCYDRIPD